MALPEFQYELENVGFGKWLLQQLTPPHDLILAKNSRHLKPLVYRKTESDDFTDEAGVPQMVAITTRKQAKEEASEEDLHVITDLNIF